MDTFRWIIGGLLIALSLFVAVGQFAAIVQASRRLKADPNAGGYSMIPLFGGLVGVIGMLIVPLTSMQRLWWLPLIVDPGCALMFGLVAIAGIGSLVHRLLGRNSS